jgi:hypothetical protein
MNVKCHSPSCIYYDRRLYWRCKEGYKSTYKCYLYIARKKVNRIQRDYNEKKEE